MVMRLGGGSTGADTSKDEGADGNDQPAVTRENCGDFGTLMRLAQKSDSEGITSKDVPEIAKINRSCGERCGEVMRSSCIDATNPVQIEEPRSE